MFGFKRNRSYVVCSRCQHVVETRTGHRPLRRHGAPPVLDGRVLRSDWSDGWKDPAAFVFGGGTFLRWLCNRCEADGWFFDRLGQLCLPAREGVTVEMPGVGLQP